MKQSVIIGLLLGSILTAFLVYSLVPNPHDFEESQCVLCHSGDRPVTETLASSVCLNCHSDIMESGFMHPVDFKPGDFFIPRDMPLSRSGYLTCSTCHDVHGDYEIMGERTYFLRRQENPRAFCVICHPDGQLGSGHTTTLAEAHFQSEYIASDDKEEIDPISKNCLGCHSGSYASSVTINAGSWDHGGNFPGPDLARKHPIGIPYKEARFRHGRKTDLRPRDEVDKRINFFDGKIGCGSCHNPYGDGHNKLVMSNRRSALCITCHMVDKRKGF